MTEIINKDVDDGDEQKVQDVLREAEEYAHREYDHLREAEEQDRRKMRKAISGAEARRTCEQIAGRIMKTLESSGTTPTSHHVAAALKDWKGTNNSNRKTASGGEDPVQSDTFGLVKDHVEESPTVGSKSRAYPELTKLLNWWARSNCGPEFEWSTFTTNNDWCSKPSETRTTSDFH